MGGGWFPYKWGITCITIKIATIIIRAMITMNSVLYLLAFGLSGSSDILNLLVTIYPIPFKSDLDAKTGLFIL